MLGINFNKRSARKNLQDFEAFEALRVEILDWISLEDFVEYVDFLDNGLAAYIAECLAEDNSTAKVKASHLEEFFSTRFELIRREHCRHFVRHDEGITKREQARLLKSINKDLKAAAVDFTNIIIGSYECTKPIQRKDISPKLQGKMDLSPFYGYVTGKGLPEHEPFSQLVHDIQSYFTMSTYSAYKIFMDENGCAEAAKDISRDYAKTVEELGCLESSILNALTYIRKVHVRRYDRHEPLSDVKKETLRLAMLTELRAVSVDFAHLVVGLYEESHPVRLGPRPPVQGP